MRIALHELNPDDKTATGERGRAVLRFLRSVGHEVSVLSPDPACLRDFARFRFSFWARLRRRVLGQRTLPHLWDYIAHELEPRVRAGGFDAVIARGQPLARTLEDRA